MNRLTKSLVAALILGAFATPLFAQPATEPPLLNQDEPVSVETLIDLALEHETNYRKAVEDQRILGALTRSAIGQFLPSLTAGASFDNTNREANLYLEDQLIGRSDQTSSYSSWSITASERIFDGLARIYGYKSAKLQAENTELATARSRDELIYTIRSYYYNLLAAEENLDVQQEVLEQRQESMRLAKARYATGDVIELDVMQAEIDLGTQENNVLDAANALESARESLNLAAGLDLDSRFPVVGDLTPALPELNEQELVSKALQNRPDFLITQNLVDIGRYDVKQVDADYFPSLSAYYQYNRSEPRPGESTSWTVNGENLSSSFGLQLNWTLFDRFNRELRRQQAVISSRKALWDAHFQEQNIDKSLREHSRSLKKLYQQSQVASRNRNLARRTLELEQERYRVGASDQINLRQAQVTFIQAEMSYLRRVLDFYTTLATLERDLGTALAEQSATP